jgi:PAS domain S-box-containing protein
MQIPEKDFTSAAGVIFSGGEMGERIRNFDWSQTSLGVPELWPECLKIAVNLILQSNHPLVIFWGEEGFFLYNDSYIPIAGNKHPSLLGSRLLESWPETAEFHKNILTECLQGKSLSYKNQKFTLYRNEIPDDAWFDLNYSPVRNEDGNPAGVLLIVEETTKAVYAEKHAKELEDELRKNEAYYRALVTATSDVVYRMSKDWSIMQQLHGQGFLSDTGEPIYDWLNKYIHPEDQNHVMSVIREAIRTKGVFQLEHRVLQADGSWGWTFSRAIPIYDHNGEILEWFGAASDQTERKRLERFLAESEALFSSLAEGTEVLIGISTETSNIIYFNRAWEYFTGRSTIELLNYGWVDLIHQEDRQTFIEKYTYAFDKKQSFKGEFRLLHKSGEYRWMSATGRPRFHPDGSFAGFLSLTSDITKQKEAEEKLKENEHRYKLLIEDTAVATALYTGPENRIQFANDIMLGYWGKDHSIIGKTFREALPELEGQPFSDYFDAVYSTGKTYVGLEERADLISEGHLQPFYFNFTYKPLRDREGKIYGIHHMALDVTAEVLAKRSLKQKNEELEKINNDLDNFIYTASHDLKAPISNLEGLLNAFITDKEFSEDKQIMVNMMFQSIDRFKKTIQDLTDISKIQRSDHMDREILNFEEILSEVRLDIRQIIETCDPKIETRFEVKEIYYSRKNLRSIVYNLLSNALKYSSPDRQPEVTISTENQDGYIMLSIADNGLGLSLEHQNKIFGMFKRAHQHVEGSGIGLYMIKKIIENNGGKIMVESELGKGTTFKVYFKQDL